MAFLLKDSLKVYLLTGRLKDYDHLTGLQMENRLESQKDSQMAKKMEYLLRVMRLAMLMAMHSANLTDSPMAKRMDYDLVNQMVNRWVIHLANRMGFLMVKMKESLPTGKHLDLPMAKTKVFPHSDSQTDFQKVKLMDFQRGWRLVKSKDWQTGFHLVIPMDSHLEMLTESLQMGMRWVTPMETPREFLPMV